MTIPEPLSRSAATQKSEDDEIEMSVQNSSPNNNNDGDEDENDDDDDDVTVILLDHNDSPDNMISMDWMEQQGPELEARRRAILVSELQRTQRISFCHFVLLCLVPALLVGVVVVAAFQNSSVDDCYSPVTSCRLQDRTFTNAFTTRCVCDPIPVVRSDT